MVERGGDVDGDQRQQRQGGQLMNAVEEPGQGFVARHHRRRLEGEELEGFAARQGLRQAGDRLGPRWVRAARAQEARPGRDGFYSRPDGRAALDSATARP